MSLLSILAVAICAKPELSLRGVKVRALLEGAVEQSLRDAGCYGGEDAGVTHAGEWVSGVEKSDDLLEMTPLRGRAHTCESGARSRDMSSVPPTGRSSPHKEEEALTQMTPFPLMLVTA